MGTNVSDAGHLQQALHCAVLAILSMEDREHHIDPLLHNTVTLKTQEALATDGRNGGSAIVGMVDPLTGGQHGIIGTAEVDPVTLPGDSHRENIVLFLIDII